MVIAPTINMILDRLARIDDPEVPVVNIVELGIIRDINIPSAQSIEVIITPTYSGCPAMDFIRVQIQVELEALGYRDIKISEVLAPPWTTDWMSENARQKLKSYGIAPPRLSSETEIISCPLCDSKDTRKVSQFGSTSCKALYQCNACSEPFEYFKCI